MGFRNSDISVCLSRLFASEYRVIVLRSLRQSVCPIESCGLSSLVAVDADVLLVFMFPMLLLLLFVEDSLLDDLLVGCSSGVALDGFFSDDNDKSALSCA